MDTTANQSGTTSGEQHGQYAELSGVRVFVDNHRYSPVIVKALQDGQYESGERHVLPRILGPGDRVLEVGSAIGCVSMVAAKIVGADNIVTFEANPRLVEDSRANFAANGLPIKVKNAVLKNRICWPGDGESVNFYINNDFWASSLVPIAGTIETVVVPTLCFEAEARAFGANALICDIEGGEIELLEHADLTGFNKIVMEVHYWAGREGINRMIRKLIFDGFSVNFDISFGSIVSLHRGLTPTPILTA